MEITQEMLNNLKHDILANTSESSKPDITIYDFGAVWQGDFYRYAERGNFGTLRKSVHYGMISDKTDYTIKPSRRIAPATSVKHSGRKVLRLSAGTLKSKPPADTYILLDLKLVVSCRQLSVYFKFIRHLAEQHKREAERILSHG